MEVSWIINTLLIFQSAVLILSAPSWNSVCTESFLEDTPLGTWLFNLTATSSTPGQPVTFSRDNTLTDTLVNLTEPWSTGTDQYTIGVTLLNQLDRDFTPKVKMLQFGAADTSGQTPLSCPITVMDVNDNAPIFLNLPYLTSVPEDISVFSTVYGNITVYDPDTGVGGQFQLNMKDDISTRNIFELIWSQGTTTSNGYIRLNSSLDYEYRTSYTIVITATDGGGLESSSEISVSVLDVQDTPPYFLQQIYRAAIKEHSPENIPVIQIQAEDGDRGNPREVEYRIKKGNTEYFAINQTSGWIRQVVSLDRDDASMRDSNGVFDLIIEAYEVNATEDEPARNDVEVTITIEDINDNAPTFNTSSTYTAYVRDDTPSESLIYFDGEGYIQVFDLDQGANAYFTLSLEKDGRPLLELQPSPIEVYYEAYVLIRILNNSIIKKYSGQHLSFDVIAKETKTVEGLSSKAAIVLTIETTEEPTTTPPPPEENPLTAPDIVVFVVGFLVLLNIATSITICVLLTRKKKKQHSQGLARNGSKYYVTVTPKHPSLSAAVSEESSSNGINNTSVMQEIP